MSLEKMVDERVKPEYYFDLSRFKHKKIFEDVEYVWDAIKRLPDYLNQCEKGIQKSAKVDPTARIDDNVYIGERTIVEANAVINGPAVIGDDCLIQSSARVKGYVLAGDFVRIGQATEVTNSILLGGLSSEKKDFLNAAHFNYIGYSIVGYGVLFGAHTATSSVRGDWKPVVVKMGDKKYETGMKQFGAVIGDNAVIGSNTCLNPGSLIGKESQLVNVPYWGGFLPSKKFVRGKLDYEILDKRD